MKGLLCSHKDRGVDLQSLHRGQGCQHTYNLGQGAEGEIQGARATSLAKAAGFRFSRKKAGGAQSMKKSSVSLWFPYVQAWSSTPEPTHIYYIHTHTKRKIKDMV